MRGRRIEPEMIFIHGYLSPTFILAINFAGNRKIITARLLYPLEMGTGGIDEEQKAVQRGDVAATEIFITQKFISLKPDRR